MKGIDTFHSETYTFHRETSLESQMNTVEELKSLLAAYHTNKTIENALRLGEALLTLRQRTVHANNGDIAQADKSEAKLMHFFKISDATQRRLKLLAIWKREVLHEDPGSLTDAYRIAEELNKAALQQDNADVNRGGRPKKTDAERSLEFLHQAAERWIASGRPRREFVERAQAAIEN
jgi:hypothetical protein